MLDHIAEDTEVAFILNPTLSSEELLASICDELHIGYDQQNLSIKRLSDAIYHHLLKRHGEGKNTILIIDEAQNLSPAVLEQMRLLTNLETKEKKLLQIVMFGQPELRTLIERPELKQLAQRITARFHLAPLQLQETEHYINHRLAIAGYKPVAQTPSPVPGNLIKQIHYLSGGVPRLINIICDRALLGAYARNEPAINTEILYQAAKEVFGENRSKPEGSFLGPLTVALGSIFIALLIYRFYPTASDWLSKTTAAQATIVQSQEAPTATVAAETNATNSVQPETSNAITSPEATEPSPLSSAASPEPATAFDPEPSNPVAPSPLIQSVTASEETSNSSLIAASLTDKPPPATQPARDLHQSEASAEPTTDTGVNAEVRAYQSLFDIWQLQMPDNQDPCLFALDNGLRCLHQQGSWQQLKRNNRPALVRTLGQNTVLNSQTLIAIDNGVAIFTDGYHRWTTPLSQLDDSSLLNYTLLWRPPEGYHKLTKPGSNGPHILWIKQQLAQLSPLFQSVMNDSFDDQLVLYVKAFQRSQNLLQDGIIGPETLIRLNTLVDRNIPLLLSNREP